MFAALQKNKAEQITAESSLVVTENLLSSLISELCYCRNIFDESESVQKADPVSLAHERCATPAFNKKKFGKTQFHALVKEQNSDVDRLLSWLEDGAFDALRKQYLKMIMLGIYTDADDPSRLTEAWYFKVNAGGGIDVEKDGGGKVSAPSTPGGRSKSYLVGTTRTQVKDITQNFVRTVVALKGNLEPLPEERFVSMRLYYKETVPEEYHPVGFGCPEDNGIYEPQVTYAREPVSLDLGQSATPFHGLQLKVKTIVLDEDDEECSNQENETYVERDVEMDEMWRESDDSDDECSQAESQVNPRQESGDEPEPEDSSSQEGNDQIVSYEPEPEDSEGNDLRRCLMLISAKATHEKVSEQELHDLLSATESRSTRSSLECDRISLNQVIAELRKLKVLLRKSGQAYAIAQGTALQILEDRFDQGPPLTQMQRSPPRASPAETEVMPTPEYPSPKPFGFSARVYGARGEDKPADHDNEETQDSQNPDEDTMAGLTNGFNNAVSLADNPETLVQRRNRPRRYGAAGRATQSLAAVRERSTALASATPLAKTGRGSRRTNRSRHAA